LGATWPADDKRIATPRAGYNSGVYVGLEESRHRLHVPCDGVQVDRWRRTFHRVQGGQARRGDDAAGDVDRSTDGKRELWATNQGAIVSFDGGDTWSSWYNQSTEQVYHVAPTMRSRTGILRDAAGRGARSRPASRGFGPITTIDWKPVPGWEWGTILPDPRDPTSCTRAPQHREDHVPERRVDQHRARADPSLKLRPSSTCPLAFATVAGQARAAGRLSVRDGEPATAA